MAERREYDSSVHLSSELDTGWCRLTMNVSHDTEMKAAPHTDHKQRLVRQMLQL